MGLSERERQVLAQVALGLTLDEVAQRLDVSRNTVHTHLKRIYRKLEISTRVEAAMVAARLGLVRF